MAICTFYESIKVRSVQLEKIFLSLCILLSLVLSHGPVFAEETLYFGWYPGDSLSMDDRRAEVFAKYLSDRSRLHIEAVKTDSADSLIGALQKNTVHFGSIPNYQYPALHESLHLLATPQYNSSTDMYLYIITNAAAGIKNLDDLKGKSAGQVMESNQLKCYFLSGSLKAKPQDFLGKITVFQNLKEAVDNVASGKVVTTCISSTAYEILSKFDPSLTKRIKIIKRSPAYAMDPMVASILLPETVWWNLQSVLINMSNDYAAQQILLPMGFHGFASPVSQLDSYPQAPAKTQPGGKIIVDAGIDKTLNDTVEKNSAQVDSIWVRSTEEKEGAIPENANPEAVLPSNTPPVDANTSGAVTAVPSTDGHADKNAVTAAVVSSPESASAGAAVTPIVPQGTATRSFLVQFMQNQYLSGGAFIALLLVVGLLTANMLGNNRKRKMLTVLLLLNHKLITLQSRLDWRGKLHLVACKSGNALSEQGIRKVLRDIGHKSAMKIVTVLNSDRLVLREFTFPLLAGNEIHPAIHWKLKDMNIPYNEESDTIHSMVIVRDRKKKEMTVQALVLTDNDSNGREWSAMNLAEDGTVCMEMALLNRFRLCVQAERSGSVVLAYRLNEHEGILLILEENNSFINRRIFGASAPIDLHLPSFSLEMETEAPAAVVEYKDIHDPIEQWNNFLPDIRQTISFYSRQSGKVVDTLYLAGPGVPSVPDPEHVLADQLAMKVEHINLLADVELAIGVTENCPAIEILAGAAMLWHKKA
ncbi:MAG: PhnD/SsuA/transferrin family substrate-binding protein [Pseudomonadota bacterium]